MLTYRLWNTNLFLYVLLCIVCNYSCVISFRTEGGHSTMLHSISISRHSGWTSKLSSQLSSIRSFAKKSGKARSKHNPKQFALAMKAKKSKLGDYDEFVDFSDNLKSNKRATLQPLTPRHGEAENLVAKWQQYGDYYVGYENLRALNDQLTKSAANRSREQKSTLRNELTLTYFARFHNILREEYQFEKRLVEERLKSWSNDRLQKEGYTLFNMNLKPRGNLYQDKVFRVAYNNAEGDLGFHRFGVGDSVRLSRSNSRLGPLSPAAIDGVVLDRRKKYLEICIKTIDSLNLDLTQEFRLDCFVNRVSYDRMLEALHLLVQVAPSSGDSGGSGGSGGSVGGGTGPPKPDGMLSLSSKLRDLILYSYPNSMVRLARSPGGIRMALPSLPTHSLSLPSLDAPMVTTERSADEETNKNDNNTNFSNSTATMAAAGVSRVAVSSITTTSTRFTSSTSATNTTSTRVQLTQSLEQDTQSSLRKSSALFQTSFSRTKRIIERTANQDTAARTIADDAEYSILTSQSQSPSSEVSSSTRNDGSKSSNSDAGGSEDTMQGISTTPTFTTVAEALEQFQKDSQRSNRIGKRTLNDNSIPVSDIESVSSMQQRVILKYSKQSRGSEGGSNGGRAASFKVVDKSEADAQSAFKATKFQPVFNTNEKLRQLAHLPPISREGTIDNSPGNPQKQQQQALSIVEKNRFFDEDEVTHALMELEMNMIDRGKPFLNPSQLQAIVAALQRPLTLIQGPPGTGKTKTACSLLATLIILHQMRMGAVLGGSRSQGLKNDRILACAHSNVAADNLLDGLVSLGVDVVRIGRPANVRSPLWNYTLDAKLQQNEQWLLYRTKLDKAVDAYNEAKPEGGPALGDAQRALATAKRQFEAAEEKCIFSVLRNCDVVVSTCIGAGADVLRSFTGAENIKFRTVLVDEAAQCTESAVFPALAYGCERLILIGDQNQLPPVVVSPTSLNNGLGVSMFSRFIAAGMDLQVLNEQYRMHPKIAEFPSNIFYGGVVKSRTSAKERPLPKGFDWPNPDIPIAFVDVSPWSTTGSASGNIPGDYDMGERNAKKSQQTAEETATTAMGQSMGNFFGGIPIGQGFENVSNATQTSYFNLQEVNVVEGIVEDLLADAAAAAADAVSSSTHNRKIDNPQSESDSAKSDGEPSSTTLTPELAMRLLEIGVISPYNAQVRALNDRFRARGWVEAAAAAEASSSSSIASTSTSTSAEAETTKEDSTRIRKNKKSKNGSQSRDSRVSASSSASENTDRNTLKITVLRNAAAMNQRQRAPDNLDVPTLVSGTQSRTKASSSSSSSAASAAAASTSDLPVDNNLEKALDMAVNPGIGSGNEMISAEDTNNRRMNATTFNAMRASLQERFGEEPLQTLATEWGSRKRYKRTRKIRKDDKRNKHQPDTDIEGSAAEKTKTKSFDKEADQEEELDEDDFFMMEEEREDDDEQGGGDGEVAGSSSRSSSEDGIRSTKLNVLGETKDEDDEWKSLQKDLEAAIRLYNSTSTGMYYSVAAEGEEEERDAVAFVDRKQRQRTSGQLPAADDDDDNNNNNNNNVDDGTYGTKKSNQKPRMHVRGKGEGGVRGGEEALQGQLEVRSVDGFQGREKEVIVISAVRSNVAGRVGFLNDWRRLNVAITRPKRGLIVVGDSHTLRHEPHWNEFLQYCQKLGCYTTTTTTTTTTAADVDEISSKNE